MAGGSGGTERISTKLLTAKIAKEGRKPAEETRGLQLQEIGSCSREASRFQEWQN